MSKETQELMKNVTNKADRAIFITENEILNRTETLNGKMDSMITHQKAIERYLEKLDQKMNDEENEETLRSIEEANSELLDDSILVVKIMGGKARDVWKSTESDKDRYRAMLWEYIFQILNEVKENGGL